MAIVWPCTLSVDEYVAAGREVEVPSADCPSCLEPMTFWSGYRRDRSPRRAVRTSCGCPGSAAGPVATTHALLPAFVAVEPTRLDVETIGAAARAGRRRPRSACVRRRSASAFPTPRPGVGCAAFGRRAASLASSFAALVVELGGAVLTPLSARARHRALAAMDTAPGGRVRAAGVAGSSGAGASARRVRRDACSPPTRTPPISSSADVVSCLLSDETSEGAATWTTKSARRSPCTAGR